MLLRGELAQTIKTLVRVFGKEEVMQNNRGEGKQAPSPFIYPEATGGSTTLMEGDGIMQVSHPLLVVKEP